MKKNKTKKIIINHIFKNGKKQISEKILKNSFKSIQKIQNKAHNEILKQTILNVTPTFRIIKLKKKKSSLEIPTFLYSYKNRTSWGLRYLIKALPSRINNNFYKLLEQEILSSAKSTSEPIKFKEAIQKNTLQKKKYFKYYRW